MALPLYIPSSFHGPGPLEKAHLIRQQITADGAQLLRVLLRQPVRDGHAADDVFHLSLIHI